MVTDIGMCGVDVSYATVTVGRAVPAKCATTIGELPLNVRVTWVSPFAVPHLYTAAGSAAEAYMNVTSVVNAPAQSVAALLTLTAAALCTSFATYEDVMSTS